MSNSSEQYFEKINTITNVSRETFCKLEIFAEHILKWNKSINLISKSQSNLHDVWERHILDSAQVAKYVPRDAKIITDFGSGAGFPGIILAIIGDWQVHLIESDERKCAFLNQISAVLEINVIVHTDRIEKIEAWESDVLTARALASVSKLLKLTNSFVDKSKLCIFLKGQNVVEEIEEASKYWDIHYKTHPSFTSDNGNILQITKVARKVNS